MGLKLYLIYPKLHTAESGLGLLNGHNSLQKHLFVMGNYEDLTYRSGKNLSHISISYESDASATLRYFFLGSGKLDPKDIRRTHPRSILASSNAVGLG